jgi:RHS repeat-associated protein
MGCIKEADSSDYGATHQSNPSGAQGNQDAMGDPVNVVTGAFTLTEQDVAIPSQRLWLQLTRHYNSQCHSSDLHAPVTPFGRGWTHTLHLRLEAGPDPCQITYLDDHHTRLVFEPSASPPRYLSPPEAPHLELHRYDVATVLVRDSSRSSSMEFDACGRLAAASKPGAGTELRVQFRYDADGQLMEVLQGSQSYALAGHVLTGPGLNEITYLDARGKRIVFQPTEDTTVFVCADLEGTKLQRSDQGTLQLQQKEGPGIDFDTLGRTAAMVQTGRKANSRLDFTYGNAGRVTEVHQGDWCHDLEVRLEPGPQPGQLTYVDGQGVRAVFSPDAVTETYIPPAGALALELTRASSGTFHLRQIDGLAAEFNASGQLLAMRRPGPEADCRVDCRYDSLGRLTEAAGAGGRFLCCHYREDDRLIRSVTDHTGRCWQYEYSERQELVKVRDPMGRARRYAYGGWDGLVSTSKGHTEARTIRAMSQVFDYARDGEEIPGNPILTNQYTSDQRVYRQTDALGNVTLFDYNRFTRTTCVTDPAGWTTVYCYDTAGNTTKVRRPGGGITEYIYDDRRNLIAEIDPFGHRTEYADLRDPHRLDSQQEFGRRAIGNRSDYVTIAADDLLVAYDRFGNRPLVRDALGQTTRFYEYTYFGRPRRVELPDGSQVDFEYDDRSGLPVHMAQALHVGREQPVIRVQRWTYDRFGNMVRHVEEAITETGPFASRRIIELQYDSEGCHPIVRREWVEAGGHGKEVPAEEHYVWDSLGRLLIATVLRRERSDAEPSTYATRYGYDVLGRQVWRVVPDGTATCMMLSPDAHVEESFLVADAQSESLSNVPVAQRLYRRRWEYDKLGREVRYTDPTVAEATREWDGRGLCVAATDPLGHSTRYQWDRDRNCTVQQTAAGYQIRTDYDQAGRKIREVDSIGKAITYEYDALGRLQTVFQCSQDSEAATRYAYDLLGRLSEVQYPDNTRECFAFDEQGNVVRHERGKINSPALSTEAFTYDPLGRKTGGLAGAPTNLVQQFTIRYNDASREVLVSDALGNVSRTFYDSQGNAITKVDAEGRTLRLEYDCRDRLRHRHSDDGLVVSQYEYDVADRLTMALEPPIAYRWCHDANGRVVGHEQTIGQKTRAISYGLDPGGRVVEKRLDASWWVRYYYAPNSPFLSRIDLPGRTVTLRNDAAGHLLEEVWKDYGRTIYTYGPDGNIAGLEHSDERGRLIFSQRLVRDCRGRPTAETRCYPGEKTRYLYFYDALDRLERVLRERGDATVDFRSYVYDGFGNRLTEHREGKLYATHGYDPANRLIETQCPVGQAEFRAYDRCGNLVRGGGRDFVYDAVARLRRVRVGDTPESSVIDFQYAATDERAVVVHRQENEQIFYDGAQEILSDSTLGQRRAYWRFPIDSALAISQAGQSPQRVCTDHLGSVIAIGSAEHLLAFDPFGNLMAGDYSQTPFGFCGKRYDPTTGLYYNRARSYDASSGRFTQPDPLGPIDGVNLYIYAQNNPTTYSDPQGFTSVKASQGVLLEAVEWGTTYNDLVKTGLREAHHIMMDSAMKEIPGYNRFAAPAIQLPGPHVQGSWHNAATRAQRAGPHGTYGAERQAAWKALAVAGMSGGRIDYAIARADAYFMGYLGLTLESPTRIPFG